MTFTRRDILTAAALAAAPSVNATTTQQVQAPALEEHANHDEHATHIHPRPTRPLVPRLPALLCKITGTVGMDAAYEMMRNNADTLEAALHVTTTQEDDVDDHTTGVGGLPTADGETQLDACCWHGPTRRMAAVGAVTGIRHVSRLARSALEEAGSGLLVGTGAHQFALAHGFADEKMMTERSTQMWNVWKEIRSTTSSWGAIVKDPNWPKSNVSPHFLPASQQDLDMLVRKMEPFATKAGLSAQWSWRAAYDALFPTAEPLCVSAVNAGGDMSISATTSGLPWRPSGVVSDIALAGVGAYLDPLVGSATASGNASANIAITGAHTIVENMRRGMLPEDAGLDALRRIVQWYRHDMTALRFVEIVFLILRKDGAYGGVSLWRGNKTGQLRQYAVHDGERRSEDCRFLFDGSPPNGCPTCV